MRARAPGHQSPSGSQLAPCGGLGAASPGAAVAQRRGLSATERQQQVSPRPEISEKGFAGKMGTVREGVTSSPALHPLRFTFGSSGHAELLERWRVEVPFPVWSGRRVPQMLPGLSTPTIPILSSLRGNPCLG